MTALPAQGIPRASSCRWCGRVKSLSANGKWLRCVNCDAPNGKAIPVDR